MLHTANNVSISATVLLQSTEVQTVLFDLFSGMGEIWQKSSGLLVAAAR
jgi:hypothetical protein